MKTEKTISGERKFSSDDIIPRSVILNFSKDTATLAYNDKTGGKKNIIKRSFNDIFSGVNQRVLDRHSNMLLPTGCIYTTRSERDRELFLMQEHPGIRTFRLSNREAVKNLVAKMYNKFQAQTRVLELNDVAEDEKEEVQKQIKLRNQYIKQQKLMEQSNGRYKYYFRAYFPYTYIIIELERTRFSTGKDKLAFKRMKAAISLDPITTFNDYLYQFPLSNVSSGGSVCTGQLPLGEYGQINIKSFVEKMTGYFWNNKFNADISTGPETYGDINFLGNWFEWEYISYVDPSAILSLKFKEENIIKDRMSVGRYISDDRGRKTVKSTPILTINEYTLVEGFEGKDSFGDTKVNLENGEASKRISGIADTITYDGHELMVGTLLKTKKKKFKIISFDGFKTYDVEDSSLIEKDTHVTHINIKDEKKRIHRFGVDDRGGKFIIDSFRRAKNYVLDAKFGDLTFINGEVVGYKEDDNVRTPATICFDMIKSIRDKETYYIIDLHKTGEIMLKKNEEPTRIEKVELLFTAREQDNDSNNHLKSIRNNENFVFRTQKILSSDFIPSPYIIIDHLSEPTNAKVELSKVEYKTLKKATYQYGRSRTEKKLSVSYILYKDGMDNEEFTSIFDEFIIEITDTKLQLLIPLPKYIVGVTGIDENVVVNPKIDGSETVIIGDHVHQAITDFDEGEFVPFKIIRDDDNVSISTVSDKSSPRDHMFFKPAIHHLKSCIEDIDGVKTFIIRDLFEAGTENEYIHFKVGDEVMLASDWNPTVVDSISIKKIHDFITIEDKYPNVNLVTGASTNEQLMGLVPRENHDSIQRKYALYAECEENEDVENGTTLKQIKASCGTVYAVIDDGSDKLILHPMIDSSGNHFLNGISHIEKEIDNLKSGDFVKADVGGIPYFAKKNVDEIVCFIKFNNRYLTIMKSGYTMWADIVSKKFKIFKRDKLTEKKLEFYTEKTRLANMSDFMVLFGDRYFAQLSVPIYTQDGMPENLETDGNQCRLNALSQMEDDNIIHTRNLTKVDLESIKDVNGGCDFTTVVGYNVNSIQNIVLDRGLSSFRSMYDTNYTLGKELGNKHIASVKPHSRIYDISYSMNNRSLTNGSAYMPMDLCFRGPLNRYVYYSSPYNSKEWVKDTLTKVTMLSFPTPRMLKKSTREINSYMSYKYVGPQNTFYTFISHGKLTHGNRYIKNDATIFSIASDNIFPKVED